MFPDKFMCRGFHQIGINVSRQLELSYPSCARCFPLMSILPLGAATAVTPMWIAPLVRLTVRACDDCTRIAVGDTIIKLLTCFVVVSMRVGTRKPCTAWTKMLMTTSSIMLGRQLVSRYSVPSCKKRLAVCPEAKSVWSLNLVTMCLGHSSLWILPEIPLTSCIDR